jgi:hypothetical protein
MASIVKLLGIFLFGLLASACQPAAPPSHPGQTGFCDEIDPMTTALGAATVECLGTANDQQYTVENGYLRRAFDKCVQNSALIPVIDNLLALQQDETLPAARACFADRWTEWKKAFARRNIRVCPVWRPIMIFGTPTREKVAWFGALPEPSREAPLLKPQIYKTFDVFEVEFPAGTPPQPCGDAGQCAFECAGGLPGYALQVEGNRVLADVLSWWRTDPPGTFTTPHRMSWYNNPPPPGATRGDVNRVGEKCTWWNGVTHMTRLLSKRCPSPGHCHSSCP